VQACSCGVALVLLPCSPQPAMMATTTLTHSHVEVVSTTHTDHSFQALPYFGDSIAKSISHEASDNDAGSLPLNKWLALLVPGGALELFLAQPRVAAAEKELIYAGFIVDNVSEGTIVARKPMWAMGDAGSLGAVAFATSDLVDEDDLLDADGLGVPQAPDQSCATKKRACKNCTCGRAELEDKAGEPQEQPTSACGNCHRGDAFRCASCPYLGQPAFEPNSSRVQLQLSDDI